MSNYQTRSRLLVPIRLLGASSVAMGMLSAGQAQLVTDRTLSRATVSGDQTCAEVQIEFNTSVQYQSHFPNVSGRELNISILPLNTDISQLQDRVEEELRPPRSQFINIQDIQFDAIGPTGGTLSVLFDHEVEWSVEQGSDFQSISIKVSEVGSNGCAFPSGAEDADDFGRFAAAPILSVTRRIPDTLNENAVYALNLESIRKEYSPDLVSEHSLFSDYAAYSYVSEENGIAWTRLRLGFFETRAEAESAALQISDAYPEAWVARTDRHERDTIFRAWLAARAQIDNPLNAQSARLDPEAEVLLREVREFVASGDFPNAVRAAQNVLSRPESASSPAAQELLAIARERAGQLAHAKAEYEIYLQKYPDGEAAATVRQRLAVLISGEQGEKAPLTPGGNTENKRDGLRADLSGSLSALYQRDESALIFEDTPTVGGSEINPDPEEIKQTNLNEMVYGVDLIGSLGNDRDEVVLRFSGLHRDDLRTENPRDQSSISSLYIDISDRQWDASLRAGRQTRNSGGVFGRFDGVYAGIQAKENVRVNVVAGAPVQSSRDLEVDPDRVFVGASVDVGLLGDKLETSYYLFGQQNGDLVDRQAAGAEFRYFDPKRSAYGVVDYDVHFEELNLALLSGTLRFDDSSSFNVALDYRRSPLLTTFNSVIGQGVEAPSDLLDQFSEDEVYQLAQDRSAFSRSAIMNYSRPLSKNLQVNVDMTATNVSGTKTSGGIIGQPATGTEFYYSGQLVGSNFLKQGAVAIAGLRYADLNTSEQYTFSLNGRYPVTRDFRVNPRLRMDSRERKDGTSEEVSGRGSMRMTYNTGRRIQWESELGGEWVDGTSMTGTTAENGFFFNLGLRLDF